MSRSVSSARSSAPRLRRTDSLPLAQCRSLRPSESKVGQHLFRVLSPGLAAQLHRLFCIFAELLSFRHGALPPKERPPYERSPHFEWLSGQNCSLYESSRSLRAKQCIWERKQCIWERVSGSSRAAPFYIAQVCKQRLEPLSPAMVGFGTHRTASLENTRCCLGWPLTFTAARLGFEAQNAAAFSFMRLASWPETAAGEIIPHAAALPEEAPALAVAAPKKRPAAKTSKQSAPAKRQRKRSKGR